MDLLAFQGILKSLLQHHSSKASVLPSSAFFVVKAPPSSAGSVVSVPDGEQRSYLPQGAVKNETKCINRAKSRKEVIHLFTRLLLLFFFGTTQTNLSMKQKLTHRCRNQTFGCQGGGAGGGKVWEFGNSRCRQVYIGWINNKVPVWSTGNYIQYPGINSNGKEYEKEHINIYV